MPEKMKNFPIISTQKYVCVLSESVRSWINSCYYFITTQIIKHNDCENDVDRFPAELCFG